MTSIRKKKLRLFFALWPSEIERTALASWQPRLHEVCEGRAMLPATLHVTLVFLGEVAENRLEALKLLAMEVDFQGFYLEFLEAHYWGHNHIVHAAPEEVPSQHISLVNELESKLFNHRFQFEQRPYKPHVTLVRNAKWSDAPLPKQSKVCWEVSDFVLVQSLNDEQGACYEVLARFSAKAD
jgi:2'-5' RNA ligase